MLVIGTVLLFLYYAFWSYFINMTEKKLRENLEFSLFGSGVCTPKSYNTFDRIGH